MGERDGLQFRREHHKPENDMSAATAALKPKSACPITADEFLANAGALECNVGGTPLLAGAKLFSTGSFGFYAGQKIGVKIGGKIVMCQVGLNITVIGSKPA